MFDLRRIPILRVLIPFLAGVMSGTLCISSIQAGALIVLTAFLWILAWISYRRQERSPATALGIFSMALFLLFYFTGMGAAILTLPADPGLPTEQVVLIRGEIEDEPHQGKYSHTFNVGLQLLYTGDSLICIPTRLRMHYRMQADSLLPAAGETWLFMGKVSPIRSNANPGDTDFRSIMGRKDCWYHFYPSTEHPATRCDNSLAGERKALSRGQIRREVSRHWHGGTEELSLLRAVCLGDRSSLSDEMRQVYATAGGMHLLAVSGLHVGLIWWVLQYMTGWVSILFRDEKQRTAAVIGILWFYAFMAGFSSSVCRSVTMFTFFSASRMMGQAIHPLSGILVSAFVLVLIDPMRLTDVGFQLSYLAITGIVCFHPLSRKLIKTKIRVFRWVWEATSVSLAAQLSTAPLVIWYFHQLPVYSLLTSLLVVPLLSLLIAIFVCSVPFVAVGIFEEFSSFLLVGLARLMNRSMEFLSSLPGAVLEGLQLDRFSLILCFMILLLLMISLHGRGRKSWYIISFIVSVLLLWNSFLVLKRSSSSVLQVSHFRTASLVSIQDGARVDHYCWIRDSTSRPYMEQYLELRWSRRAYENRLIEDKDSLGIQGSISSCIYVTEGTYLIGARHICGLVLTGGLERHDWEWICRGWTAGQLEQPDFILLSGEPFLGALPGRDCLKDIDIVIDGSNRNWYRERMILEADSVHMTDPYGAFVKRW